MANRFKSRRNSPSSHIISHAYLSNVFIYDLDLYNLVVELYSLLCFVLHSLLTCTRQEAQMSGTTIPQRTFSPRKPPAKRMKNRIPPAWWYSDNRTLIFKLPKNRIKKV